MKRTRRRLIELVIVLLSSVMLTGASRCTDCGPGTYYSETTRNCEARLSDSVEIDSATGAIVAQLSDEVLASLQVSIMQLQSRIETLETVSSGQAANIEANAAAIASLPDFVGWDRNAADDFDGSYASLSGAPVLLDDLAGYVEVDTSSHQITFSGVNVRVLDGTGSTACSGSCNGLGNLVVGYDEGSASNKTGSHNLVTGSLHTYLSYGGFLAGRNNSVEAEYGAVSGGQGNVVGAEHAAICGGVDNSATGDSASVSGGRLNAAISNYTWIGGGQNNRAVANYGVVTGGDGHEVAEVNGVVP